MSARFVASENQNLGDIPVFFHPFRYYHFTELACQLNEMEEGVAPTDSRLRPDQRLMEEGLWEDSNREKLR